MNNVVKITKTYEITRCADCPNLGRDMEFRYCKEIEKTYGAYSGIMGYKDLQLINKKCPFLNKEDENNW